MHTRTHLHTCSCSLIQQPSPAGQGGKGSSSSGFIDALGDMIGLSTSTEEGRVADVKKKAKKGRDRYNRTVSSSSSHHHSLYAGVAHV